MTPEDYARKENLAVEFATFLRAKGIAFDAAFVAVRRPSDAPSGFTMDCAHSGEAKIIAVMLSGALEKLLLMAWPEKSPGGEFLQ